MSVFMLLAINLGVAVALMSAAWVVSTVRRNAGLIDGFWGLAFVAIACMSLAVAPAATPRAFMLVGLVAVWGLRLSIHLFARNWNRPEDRRYAAMRAFHGAAFVRRSFLRVFMLQAVLAWFISLPVQLGVLATTPVDVTPLDWLGAALALFGIGFESLADAQLARFVADPKNHGTVLDRGLWRWSRHPNYFGECVVWWGIFLLACSPPFGAATVLSPLLISVLLIRISGVPLLEKDMAARRPGYSDYVRRTSSFIPWPPTRIAQS